MRILSVVDYYQPRLGYGSYYISKTLVELGHKVTLLTSNFYYPFPNYKETVGKMLGERRLPVSVKNENGVTVVRKKMIFEVFTRAIFGGQLEYLKKVKPGIVLIDKTASFHTVVFSLLKPFFGFRLISIDAHLPSGLMAEGNQFSKKVFYFIFRILFSGLINSRVDKFIAVQEDTRKIMTTYYGVKSKKIVHIPLGTDLKLYKFNKNERAAVREKYRIKGSDFVAVYTGKIIKEKGVHILFSAFNKIAAKDVNIKLLLVGAANREYEQRCLELLDSKYHKRVIWVGFQEVGDLYKYLSASDVGVWPLQESMSMNDAASCGLPFIANNHIGARLRLSNNNALLYKEGNVNDLAKHIDFLYKHKKISKEMGKRGRKLMESKFDWKVIAAQYIS